MDTQGGFLIAQIKQLQDRIFEKLLSDEGLEISGSQGRILFVLWKEDNLTMSEIGRRTSLANNTLSSVIDKMTEKGIVSRRTDEENRRQVIISLTDISRSYRETYTLVSQRMTDIFYEGFSEAQITAFEKKLGTVLENLKNCESPGG